MIRGVLVATMLTLSSGATEFETTFENSNFILSMPINGTGEHKFYNANRFRLSEHIREKNWFLTAIGDIQNHLGYDILHSDAFKAADALRADTPFEIQSKTFDYSEGEMYARLYRLYGGYADESHRISLGIQKVSMGVGRIWNPTDLFNPKNPLALEPDEVRGAFALAYTYSPSSLSQMSVVSAMREDKSFKHAGRIKGYLTVADAALNVIHAEDVTMIGYELEGELMTTGIELRSEGGWFKDKLLDKTFIQALVGADYGFENSLAIALEWLHTSRTFEPELLLGIPSGTPNNLVRSRDYAGISGSYELDPLLYGALSAIISAKDGSFYLSPSVRYSLDDDMTLVLGALLHGGEDESEFGNYGQTYYLNFKVTF